MSHAAAAKETPQEAYSLHDLCVSRECPARASIFCTVNTKGIVILAGDTRLLYPSNSPDYNKVIPLAEGEKDQRIREADGYRLKRINEAEGDTSRFNALLTEYKKAPEVTRRRIYLETLQDVMPDIRSKIVVDESSQGILPLLNLNSGKEVLP